MSAREKSTVIRLIAVFRLIKAALLILVAVNAPRVLHPAVAARLQRWAAELPYVSSHGGLQRAIAALPHMPRQRLEEYAIALVAYALLFTVEGVGLWLDRRWAEYLTIVATASFIPFEIYEVMKKMTVIRAGTLVLNVAILIYLIVRRVRGRRSL
jgi:uncharacterized membrane protein (DUF2068 family)